MSYHQRTPCRFYNTPGGCRRGQQCSFAHSPVKQTGQTGTDDARSVSPPSDGISPRFTPRPLATTLPPPKGMCRFFWTQGQCSKSFDCHWQHQTGPGVKTAGRPSTPQPSKVTMGDRLAPYLTEQGLSKMNGGGTDGFFFRDSSNSLSPIEAHNFLTKFLFDNSKFHKTYHIYSFLIPLNSANSSNDQWVSP